MKESARKLTMKHHSARVYEREHSRRSVVVVVVVVLVVSTLYCVVAGEHALGQGVSPLTDSRYTQPVPTPDPMQAVDATTLDGAFRYPLELDLPRRRGQLPFSLNPTYSSRGADTEWGHGWDVPLCIERVNRRGPIRYSDVTVSIAGLPFDDTLSTPFGEMTKGADGTWIPRNFATSHTWAASDNHYMIVVHRSDGTEFLFGDSAREIGPYEHEVIYTHTRRWCLVQVSRDGHSLATLDWNSPLQDDLRRQRLAPVHIAYGGDAPDYEYAIDIDYGPVAVGWSAVSNTSRRDRYRLGHVNTIRISSRDEAGALQERLLYHFEYIATLGGDTNLLRAVTANPSGAPASVVHRVEFDYGRNFDPGRNGRLSAADMFNGLLDHNEVTGDAFSKESQLSLFDRDYDGLLDLEFAPSALAVHGSAGPGDFVGYTNRGLDFWREELAPPPLPPNACRPYDDATAPSRPFWRLFFPTIGGPTDLAVHFAGSHGAPDDILCDLDGTPRLTEYRNTSDFAYLSGLADINQDGATDLVAMGFSNDTATATVTTIGHGSNNALTFTGQTITDLAMDFPQDGPLVSDKALVPPRGMVDDVNGDGIPDVLDLVWTQKKEPVFALWFGLGWPQFSKPAILHLYDLPACDGRALHFANVDDDPMPEAVVLCAGAPQAIWAVNFAEWPRPGKAMTFDGPAVLLGDGDFMIGPTSGWSGINNEILRTTTIDGQLRFESIRLGSFDDDLLERVRDDRGMELYASYRAGVGVKGTGDLGPIVSGMGYAQLGYNPDAILDAAAPDWITFRFDDAHRAWAARGEFRGFGEETAWERAQLTRLYTFDGDVWPRLSRESVGDGDLSFNTIYDYNSTPWNGLMLHELAASTSFWAEGGQSVPAEAWHTNSCVVDGAVAACPGTAAPPGCFSSLTRDTHAGVMEVALEYDVLTAHDCRINKANALDYDRDESAQLAPPLPAWSMRYRYAGSQLAEVTSGDAPDEISLYRLDFEDAHPVRAYDASGRQTELTWRAPYRGVLNDVLMPTGERVSVVDYDWALDVPSKIRNDRGGLKLDTRYTFDSLGRPWEEFRSDVGGGVQAVRTFTYHDQVTDPLGNELTPRWVDMAQLFDAPGRAWKASMATDPRFGPAALALNGTLLGMQRSSGILGSTRTFTEGAASSKVDQLSGRWLWPLEATRLWSEQNQFSFHMSVDDGVTDERYEGTLGLDGDRLKVTVIRNDPAVGGIEVQQTTAVSAEGDVLDVEDETGNRKLFSYHPSGRLKATEVVGGPKFAMAYDVHGRPTHIDSPLGSVTVAYVPGKDLVDSITRQIADATVVSRFAYDAASRVKLETRDITSSAEVTHAESRYYYDGAHPDDEGRRDVLGTFTGYSDGSTQETWDYDADGRVVRHGLGAGAAHLAETATYYLDGQPRSYQRQVAGPNGAAEESSLELVRADDGELLALRSPAGPLLTRLAGDPHQPGYALPDGCTISFDIQRPDDQAGKKTANWSCPDGHTEMVSYSFDDQGRLREARASKPGQTQDLTFDYDHGRLAHFIRDGHPWSYAYSADETLASRDFDGNHGPITYYDGGASAGSQLFSFDGLGRERTTPTANLGYVRDDVFNVMSHGPESIQVARDVQGRRVVDDVGNGSTSPAREPIWINGIPLEVKAEGVAHAALYTPSGTALSTSAGGCEPYGLSDGATECPALWGRAAMPGSSLHSFGTREYDATLGAFASLDPSLALGGPCLAPNGVCSTRGFADGDPVNRVDLQGLQSIDISADPGGGPDIAGGPNDLGIGSDWGQYQRGLTVHLDGVERLGEVRAQIEERYIEDEPGLETPWFDPLDLIPFGWIGKWFGIGTRVAWTAIGSSVTKGARTPVARVMGVIASKSDRLFRMVKHHVFPQAAKLAAFFRSRGIDIHKLTVFIPTHFHEFLHSPLRFNWNGKWEQWIAQHPNASANEVIQFGQQLLNEGSRAYRIETGFDFGDFFGFTVEAVEYFK